jgi:glycosyltransferase involved in cell wall biosynthesis
MSEPRVSFVVNAYNTERYIADCLRSIFAQEDAPAFEVIIIDDCSTDGTGEVVKQFNDSRLRYIRHEVNQQSAASVTHGMALARGRFIARIDSDDVYHPHFLRLTLAVLESNANVGLVYGDVRYIDADGVPNGGSSELAKRRGGRPAIARELRPMLFEYHIPAPTILARREAWALSLPIPEGRNYCDWYCSLQMARQWDFAFVDEILADYRLHPGNMHKDMVRQKYGETITWQNLDELFAAENFGASHEALRQRVYAIQYRGFGEKYFGFGMWPDARRCYLQSLRCDPRVLFEQWPILRRAVASCLPRSLYDRVKSLRR